MIELKPSKKLEAEYSSLFINCPDTDNHGRTIENIIKISGQTLEVFSDDQKDGMSSIKIKFLAIFKLCDCFGVTCVLFTRRLAVQ